MATITTIQSTDAISDSRGVINTNFSNLNTDKIEADSTDTLTNKTIDADNNTISNISNNELDTTAGALGGAWQSWTPSWTNLTVGNGTVTAKYIQIGKTVHVYLRFSLGSTSSISGTITSSLPVNASYTIKSYVGSCYIENNGVIGYVGNYRLTGTNSLILQAINSSGSYSVAADTASTVPFSWGTGDFFAGYFTYEAA